MLSRQRVLDLLAELDDGLCAAGVRGDVFIVRGAAMTVAYDARPAIRDVDGIWHPSSDVRAAAHRVASRHDDRAYVVTDNDGVEDWTGETQLLDLGRVHRLFR